MQKKALIFVLILAFATILSAVNAQDDPYADVDPSGAVITYWHEWDGAQLEGIEQIIAMFNESNEWGITVEQTPLGTGTDVRNTISTNITTGDLPNLGGSGFASDGMGYYMDGVLVTFDAFLDSPTWGFSEEEAAVIDFDILNRNRPSIEPFNGQLVAWPTGISAEIMSVNLSLLAEMFEAGLIDFEGVPADTDQFWAAACAASELNEDITAGYAGRPSGADALTWMANFGGIIFDAEADAYVFTDEGALAGLQYIQDLYNEGCMYIPDGAYANTGQFSLGFNVFAPGSTVGAPFIQGDMDSAELSYTWTNAPFPAGPAGQFVSPTLRGVTMFESTPEENLATWLFIKYWATNPEAQVIWTESAQYQPFNTATLDNLSQEFLTSIPQFGAIQAELQRPDVSFINTPEHPRSYPVQQVAGELFFDITQGGMDVAEAAAAAEAEANEIYQEDLENLADA